MFLSLSVAGSPGTAAGVGLLDVVWWVECSVCMCSCLCVCVYYHTVLLCIYGGEFHVYEGTLQGRNRQKS